MRPDIDCYRANYNFKAWKTHAALTGNENCAPIASALAVTALCDAYESLESILAESRSNDMASMRLVADCRFAVGDDGKRMFPEFVEFLKELKNQRDELLAAQYAIAQGAAQLAIEKCKNATGQHRSIDMFVSANQCAEDIIKAIARANAKGSAS